MWYGKYPANFETVEHCARRLGFDIELTERMLRTLARFRFIHHDVVQCSSSEQHVDVWRQLRVDPTTLLLGQLRRARGDAAATVLAAEAAVAARAWSFAIEFLVDELANVEVRPMSSTRWETRTIRTSSGTRTFAVPVGSAR